MNELISSLMDNDSLFGKIMTRFGIIIGANLMFVLFSLPVVTIGASWAALYHVMFKTLRGNGVVNPFKQFWTGFKSNFKQATITWILGIAIAFLLYTEFRITTLMSGGLEMIRYGLIVIAVIMLILFIYVFPVMTAFADSLPHLFRNSFFFALKKPFKLLVLLFFNVFPLYLTYTDAQMMPLYGFLWIFFGYAAIALLGAVLLLPEFEPFLPAVDDEGNILADSSDETSEGNHCGEDVVSQKSDKEIMDEMKKLGM